MSKKIIIIILVVALIFSASYFYFKDESIITATNNIDTSLFNNVVELEKNLVLAQFRKISFKEFKDNTNSFIHPYYADDFFDRIEKNYNGAGNIAAVTQLSQLPYFLDISKVYTREDEVCKFIFVKIRIEGYGNQAGERYRFIKDKNDGKWKISGIGNYVFSLDMKRPEKDVETFTNFNGTPIEYESIKIYE